MYGSRSPVLRHFGADELATLGTLQSIEDRRQRGEYVAPYETLNPRPPPNFNQYFEFDRPVPSGIPPNARDMLAEDAAAPPALRRSAASYNTPPSGVPTRVPYAASPPPPAANYSSPEVSYQDQGAVNSGNVSGGGATSVSAGGDSGSGGAVAASPSVYDPRSQASRRPYGMYSSHSVSPASNNSPARSPGRTPSSQSYDPSPSIQQPPFRAGVPASGPVRRPGMTAQPGGRRRTTSSSADRSRSPSPSQPLSNDTATSPSQQPSDPDVAAARRSSRTGGLAAKISGRPGSAGPGRAGAGAARRPASAALGGRGGGGARPAGRAPAWAPASGIANMRLDDVDEATRVALMLNDPAVRQDGAPADPQQALEQRQQMLQQQVQDAAAAGAVGVEQPPPLPQHPGGAAVSPGPHPSASPSPGRATRASDVSEHYYDHYRLRKHRESEGVPDYRFSQPRSYGAHAPLQQQYFSFDEAHPALAEQHYVRSPAQERMLQAERRKLQQQQARAARAATRHARVASPLPSSQQLAADVDRLVRVREAGRARLRELEQEGETLRQETRQVQQRALDAIARSEQITAVASRSPSPPAASPAPRRSRSPRPSAYYSGAGGGAGYYSRGTFGPPGGYYSRSPSRSPGRFRPASASPSGAYYSPGGRGQYDAQAQYDAESYYAAMGAAAMDARGSGGQRPVSAPSGSPPPVPSEAQQILNMIESVERLPQHAQTPLDSGPAAPSADHLVRASSVAASRRDMGLLGPDEQRIAMGLYDRGRYEEYQRQTDLEMQRRALEDGYNSDLERDQAAGELVHDERKATEEEEARRRAREKHWEQENAAMDEYRKRFGPEDGYHQSPRDESSAGASGSSPGGSLPGSLSLRPQQSLMSDEEEALVQEPYVPIVSPELTLSPGLGYASEGPDGYHPHRRTARRLFFKTTVPEPFDFEEREKARPKPISKVKLEQDMALRRAEEEAARHHRFRASPVPPAVLEPRYERMLLEAEVKRQQNQQYRLEELAGLLEKPFSFYYRDKEQAAEREALIRAAKDPNRFQAAFRARDVPTSTKEERFRMMMLEMEARREAAKRRVEAAREAAKERAVQEAQQRRAAADRAYRERLRAVDPALHPYPPKPLGVVPDFNALHRQFEVHVARTRANTRKRVTVPHEFRLNGVTPEEQAARARKAEERRQRIILDMQMDAELLPEARWPHKSPRGKVRRTPPPAYLLDYMARNAGPTHAANARKSSTAVAAQGGAYRTRAEKDDAARRASEKLRAETLRRADRLLREAQERREKELQAAGGGGVGGGFGGVDDFRIMSDVGATAAGGADQGSSTNAARDAAARRRAVVAGRQDNPEVYVEARHAQIERRVHEVVEDALLDQGIEAYRYVEGLGDRGGGGGRGKKEVNNRGAAAESALES